MAAPTPVSAYLHSATMVKAGVFLLVRLWPALGGTNEWLWLVGSAGLITFILGAFLALFQQDLKGLLAYSTISHLGLITLLIGLDTPLGLVAAIFHIMNHATFKASLFMAAGIIDHESGTRDIRRLSGLWRFMPITATLAMVAAAAMAGVPLLNGFLSKEMFFAETIEIHDNSLVDQALPYIVTAASMFTVAYSLRFIRDVFFGPPPTDLPRTPREPPFLMRFPAELLVLACLVVGIAPVWYRRPGSRHRRCARCSAPATPAYSLAVWHGFTPELLMSVVALGGGVAAVFACCAPTCSAARGPAAAAASQGTAHLRPRARHSVRGGWRDGWRTCSARGVCSRNCRCWSASPFVAGAGTAVRTRACDLGRAPDGDLDLAFALVWAVGIACALGAAYQAKFHRFAALILLGRRWPRHLRQLRLAVRARSRADAARRRDRDHGAAAARPALAAQAHRGNRAWRTLAATHSMVSRSATSPIALGAGAGLAALAYAVMTRPPPDSIARYFVENAYTQGGGTNS